MKGKNKRYLGLVLVIVLTLLWATKYCPHKTTYTKIVQEATCFELGKKETVCQKCDYVLESKTLEKTAHIFGDYELVVKPTALKPGIEVRTCTKCLKQEKRDYYCIHEIDVEEKWIYTKYATPFESGERYKHCKLCEAELTEKYTIPILANNSIYITGTDINASFTISYFTQSAVDSNDIVYTEKTKIGSNNPFVLGHKYGSLGILYQTEVGAHIYIYINGKIEIYEVVVSEYALQNLALGDIVGQTTGTSIWDTYSCKSLRLYTCYGDNRDGRWIVVAKKIM